MKNKILLISGLLLILALPVFALPLVPCGTQFIPCTPCHLWLLSSRIVSFLLFQLATPILVIALLAGGIVWLTSSGNPAQIEKGKKILTSSIVGIFIAFGGWLIVNSIIQTLAEGKGIISWNEMEQCPVAIQTAPIGGTPSGGITTIPKPIGAVFSTETEGETFLNKAGILVINQSGSNCHIQSDPGCTSVVGLPISTAQHLTDLKTTGLNFFIIGGTEVGHKEHGSGKPVVDLVPATPTGGTPRNNTPSDFLQLRNQISGLGGQAYCENSGGTIRYSNCDGGTSHVHVVWP
ncbi:hypothetical protein A3B05_00775 [Candidatus Giovannonibacteria bacterium RIFCSPLOWO2_01_FULL_43_160]|uniref:Uncharacterized protein n=2 Tax=Candidatus Giovannoniibacteriota TaxID=1752738 RepID=A0A0G1IWM5_9BACT|nr:MAG: hypothetical protein UV72_C0001G0091 [Candidatus Giovannonibacteria bacterium GW2011_GWB1_43_13]KKS99706.1 MAG: hypothetical protein UV75_C0002G0087 [Candidatus Giovannonibacteria bacterium GW2011_GWA1_43_15]KKT21884.1 MAG: hypothetical protein UW05_C0001G0031 [Candidatus Giovannonibacteria bacterium GW2011_GWC2_43_8]KKT63791.1 MAG: hypothetical protein UW55_C0001G0084 [Candidatus Giovannonibacteria bacterium GW2011_GWA2_44_26]OGF58236.1 MAG: hypothetical protein A2652_00075 [Candidatus